MSSPFEPRCKASAEEKTVFNVILILPHTLYIPKTQLFKDYKYTTKHITLKLYKVELHTSGKYNLIRIHKYVAKVSVKSMENKSCIILF